MESNEELKRRLSKALRQVEAINMEKANMRQEMEAKNLEIETLRKEKADAEWYHELYKGQTEQLSKRNLRVRNERDSYKKEREVARRERDEAQLQLSQKNQEDHTVPEDSDNRDLVMLGPGFRLPLRIIFKYLGPRDQLTLGSACSDLWAFSKDPQLVSSFSINLDITYCTECASFKFIYKYGQNKRIRRQLTDYVIRSIANANINLSIDHLSFDVPSDPPNTVEVRELDQLLRTLNVKKIGEILVVNHETTSNFVSDVIKTYKVERMNGCYPRGLRVIDTDELVEVDVYLSDLDEQVTEEYDDFISMCKVSNVKLGWDYAFGEVVVTEVMKKWATGQRNIENYSFCPNFRANVFNFIIHQLHDDYAVENKENKLKRSDGAVLSWQFDNSRLNLKKVHW